MIMETEKYRKEGEKSMDMKIKRLFMKESGVSEHKAYKNLGEELD